MYAHSTNTYVEQLQTWIYIYIYIYTYTHKYIHIFIVCIRVVHSHTYINILAYVYTCKHTHTGCAFHTCIYMPHGMHTYTHAYIPILSFRKHTYIYISTYVVLCMCVCMYVCMYVCVLRTNLRVRHMYVSNNYYTMHAFMRLWGGLIFRNRLSFGPCAYVCKMYVLYMCIHVLCACVTAVPSRISAIFAGSILYLWEHPVYILPISMRYEHGCYISYCFHQERKLPLYVYFISGKEYWHMFMKTWPITVTVTVAGNFLNTKVLTLVSRQLSQPVSLTICYLSRSRSWSRIIH